MSRLSDQSLVAVLGPTNTGKTHLAIERMSAHSSGMIGFPLRLLAREVYDRVVRPNLRSEDEPAAGNHAVNGRPDRLRIFSGTENVEADVHGASGPPSESR